VTKAPTIIHQGADGPGAELVRGLLSRLPAEPRLHLSAEAVDAHPAGRAGRGRQLSLGNLHALRAGRDTARRALRAHDLTDAAAAIQHFLVTHDAQHRDAVSATRAADCQRDPCQAQRGCRRLALLMLSVPGAPWQVDLAVRSMQQRLAATVCGSYGARAVLLLAPCFNTTTGSVVWVSQWASSPSAGVLSLALTLHQEGVLMNVMVVRNTTYAVAQCTERSQTVELVTSDVFAALGIGQDALYQGQQLSTDTVWRTTGHSNADSLFSFVAHSIACVPVAVSLKSLLVAHLSANLTVLLANTTHLRGGKLAFDYGFRDWCWLHHGCEDQYFMLYARLAGRGNMLRVDCAQQHRAREWLARAVGTHCDAGHVEALCELVGRQQHADAFLVVARHTLNRQQWSVQAYTTFLWPQFVFETLVA